MFAHGEPVTRLRATVTLDPYSGEPDDLDWTTPDALVISDCGFDPGGSLEPTEVGRTSVITQPTVYAPTGADVTAQDRLVCRGVTYDVDGQPAAWRSPFTGWLPGTVIKLREVAG